MKLNTKLLIAYTIVGGVLLAGIGYFAYANFRQEKLDSIYDGFVAQLRHVDWALTDLLLEVEYDVLTLVENDLVRTQDDGQFTSFLNADEATFEYNIGEAEQAIIDVLNTYRLEHPYANSVYMGRENGSFVRSHPRARPRKSYTLMGDETYILIANGIVSPSGYSPATPFDIYVKAMGREEAGTAGNTDILVFHGSTDAPTVDIYESTAGELINDLAYGEYDDDYLQLPTADYTLQVRDETGTTVVASYSAPLATLSLDDSALVAVASGFFAPANNSDGAAFGIWVALPIGGSLIELPSIPVSTNDILRKQVDLQIWPIPASRDLTISFTLDEASEINMDILSITGQMVMSRDLGSRSSGSYSETIDVSSFKEGIYLLRFRSDNNFTTSKIKVAR